MKRRYILAREASQARLLRFVRIADFITRAMHRAGVPCGAVAHGRLAPAARAARRHFTPATYAAAYPSK